MPEQTVWRGTSSQWKNLGTFLGWGILAIILLCLSVMLSQAANVGLAELGYGLFALFLVPVVIVAVHYLKTRAKIYELTTERLKITQGIFSKVTDTLELYRVKDIETRQPFFYRLGKVENVRLNTSDASTPFVLIDAVPCTVSLGDKIRNEVETIRQQKRVREIDIE